MVARTALVETEEQLVSRFIGGLRYQIQIAMQQFNPLTVSEAYQRAAAMEIQYRSAWGTANTRARASTSQATETSTNSSSEPAKTSSTRTGNATTAASESIAQSRPQRTGGALRCYTCGEPGHMQSACPNSNRRGLLNQDVNLDT